MSRTTRQALAIYLLAVLAVFIISASRGAVSTPRTIRCTTYEDGSGRCTNGVTYRNPTALCARD